MSPDQFMAFIKALFEQYFGERCPDREAGCPCCEMWAIYDLIDVHVIKDD
jgi:hypothetical protein